VNRGLRLLVLLGTLVVLIAAFLAFVRPWYLRWGATDEEARRELFGDSFLPRAASQETRAITIRAPVERVWPWLAQLGQDRGGFYSFDLLENLVGCQMPTEDRLRPERQSWHAGDRLWLYPSDRGGGKGFVPLIAYEPGRALVFGSTGADANDRVNGTWAMRLEPIDATRTRLLIRGRGAGGRSLLGLGFDRGIFEPMHFVMERRMMIGIRDLAERGDRGRIANHVHVALWTATFGLFVAAFVAALRRERWIRAWLAFGLSGVVFAFLTLVQPPLFIGVILVVALTFLLAAPTSSTRSTVRVEPPESAVDLARTHAFARSPGPKT